MGGGLLLGFFLVITRSYVHLWILPSTTLRSDFNEAAESLLFNGPPGFVTTALCGNNSIFFRGGGGG